MTDHKNKNISWEEQIERLNEKLEKYPPTKVQSDYYEFSERYKGYEFIDVTTGVVLTKFQLWTKAKGSVRKINKWLNAKDRQYMKRLKVDWVINKQGKATRVEFPRKRNYDR
jgi:hypothetical protein